MAPTITYCFTPVSPWAYLGHERFVQLAAAAGAQVAVRPVDYGAIFPASGGLPLAKRAPQRQAYRLVELQRFSQHLGLPLNLHPRHFPTDAAPAARLIISVDEQDGADAALRLSGALLRGVWAEERNIANAATLADILAACGLAAQRLAQSQEPAVQQRFEQYTQQALQAGVFGAPSYILDGEIFWGQDRLDFLQRRLQAA